MAGRRFRKALKHDRQEEDDDFETWNVNPETGTDRPNGLTSW
jgi:hypothetical protein